MARRATSAALTRSPVDQAAEFVCERQRRDASRGSAVTAVANIWWLPGPPIVVPAPRRGNGDEGYVDWFVLRTAIKR
jgi:hypothetical protein